jgi:hypothetical protein
MKTSFMKHGMGFLGYALLLNQHPCLAYAMLFLHYLVVFLEDLASSQKKVDEIPKKDSSPSNSSPDNIHFTGRTVRVGERNAHKQLAVFKTGVDLQESGGHSSSDRSTRTSPLDFGTEHAKVPPNQY